MRQIWQASQGHLQLILFDCVRDVCAIRLNRLIQREVSLEAGRPVTVHYIVTETSHAL